MVQKHRISTNIGKDQKVLIELKQDFDFNCRDKIKGVNCIYIIKNKLNDKIYVGSAVNLKKRITEHYNLLKNSNTFHFR